MKLLLTSGGLINKSIVDSLQQLLGKPFNKCNAVFIPTAANVERGDKWWLVKDLQDFNSLGWQQMDIIDISACASLQHDLWWDTLQNADAIIVGGGNSFYLSYWFKKSGLMRALPNLLKKAVYVGISAGSMLASAGLQTVEEKTDKSGVKIIGGPEYGDIGPVGQSSADTAKLAPITIRPHFNSPLFPNIRDKALQKIAVGLPVPLYAIDDQTAIKVVDGNITVVSEGEFKIYG